MNIGNDQSQEILIKITQINDNVINQSLLIQTIINLLKKKNTLPLITDQEVIDEFIKVRDEFLKQQREAASKVLVPKKEIVIAEKTIETEK